MESFSSQTSSIPSSSINDAEVEPVKQISESFMPLQGSLAQEKQTELDETNENVEEKQKIVDFQDQINAGQREKITGLEEQNQSKAQEIIQLEETVKEKEELCEDSSQTTTGAPKHLLRRFFAWKKEKSEIATGKDNKITELKQEIETCKKEAEKALQEKQKIIDLQDQIIAGNQDKITDLEQQNQNKEQEIIRLEKAIKEKEEIIDGQASTIEEEKSEKAKIQNAYGKENNQLKNEIAALQTKNGESDAIIRQMESKVLEKANQITEFKETNSKMLNPNDMVTVHRLNYIAGIDVVFKVLQKKTFLTSCLCYDGTKWFDEGGIEVRLDDSSCKIFVQHLLNIKSLPATKFSTLIDRLHPKSFCKLYLKDLTISAENFKNLVRKNDIRHLKIHRVTVTNEDGTLISVDQVMKEVPDVEQFRYIFNDGESMEGLAQKLVEIPKFQELCRFQLFNIQEGFDLEAFGQFIQKNAIKDGDWILQFKVSKETSAKIYRIQKEILSTLPSPFSFKIYK